MCTIRAPNVCPSARGACSNTRDDSKYTYQFQRKKRDARRISRNQPLAPATRAGGRRVSRKLLNSRSLRARRKAHGFLRARHLQMPLGLKSARGSIEKIYYAGCVLSHSAGQPTPIDRRTSERPQISRRPTAPEPMMNAQESLISIPERGEGFWHRNSGVCAHIDPRKQEWGDVAIQHRPASSGIRSWRVK